MTHRNPKVDPAPGDVIRKFECDHVVVQVEGGGVDIRPPLLFRRWTSVEFFRAWARDAEVVYGEREAA